MEQFSSLNIFLIISLIILFFSIPFLFISTLQNTIKATNPKNRTIEPYEVWLYFIPVIGFFFHFNHILKITNTLKYDFEDKKINHDNERLFGANFGLSYCLINIGYLFYGIYKISNYSNDDRNFLSLAAVVLIIVSGINFIIFWSKMAKCKRILLSMNFVTNDHHENNLNQDEDCQIKNIEKKTCLKCGSSLPFEQKFCMECGSSDFKLNSINTEKSEKIIINENEKECPSCKFIINKDNEKCEFCDYDFDLKQINRANKDLNVGSKSRKKTFLFTIIIFLILFFIGLVANFMAQKNIDNNKVANDVVKIDVKPMDTLTQTEEVLLNQYTCANCGISFTGFGYMMISEGNCISCAEENSDECVFCSEACGIEDDKKSTDRYNKILNEHGYNSLNDSSENEDYQTNQDCTFTSDDDVLAYLIGKSFHEKGGSATIRFSTDGAVLSGTEQYQWISYKSMGGYKGYVKLASINPSHPDGTLKLWVSCRENAVTDGETVLLYD